MFEEHLQRLKDLLFIKHVFKCPSATCNWTGSKLDYVGFTKEGVLEPEFTNHKSFGQGCCPRCFTHFLGCLHKDTSKYVKDSVKFNVCLYSLRDKPLDLLLEVGEFVITDRDREALRQALTNLRLTVEILRGLVWSMHICQINDHKLLDPIPIMSGIDLDELKEEDNDRL